jgi:ATP-dependent helicase/nuclease subunit B
LLRALADQWTAAPPEHLVIAAGSTGSIPATADLLTVIAALPEGRVVLPGLDRDLDTQSWRMLGESHPQYGLAQLLDRLEITRDEVRDWPALPGISPSNVARARLISEVMRPEATAEAWQDLGHLNAAAIDGVRVVSSADPQAEAGVIALMLRRSLEEPGRTAALVTADRALARRVRAELARWDIEIDDSAGRPLSDSVPVVFLRLVLKALAEGVAPVPLLALLKHPLAAGGQAAAAFRTLARRLERKVLRGPRPAPGFGGLIRALRAGDDDGDAMIAWLDELAAAAAPLVHALASKTVTITDLVEAHIALAEYLAGDDTEPGAARLWAGDAGTASAALMAELAEAADGLAPIAGTDYPALFDSLLERLTVRPRYGTHPRLAIWGPLEARLQQADLLVLGGLNEGSWPAEAAADPWLSRPMRAAFGLPSPERMIGLAAHDFSQALASPQVIVTRAEKVDGTPTVPSRWLTRLDAVLDGAGLAGATAGDAPWTAWQAALDVPDTVQEPLAPPEPRPPVEARPRRLSVTRIERLMRDPYSIYAQYVLDLRALDPIDAPVTLANYGSYIHQTLDRFVAAHSGALPGDAHARLIEIGRAVFAPVAAHPSLWAFWWPRFERIANWFIAIETARRAAGLTSVTECRGALELDAPAGPFTLTAIADRIDIAPGGGLEIIDYKTGAIPRDAEVVAGFSPQLPLEAAIARAGGFADLAPGPPGAIDALSFWRLTGRGAGGEVHTVGHDAVLLADEALAGLARLIAVFDNPDTPYRAVPAAEAPRYSDYTHLARVGEWSAVGEGDE